MGIDKSMHEESPICLIHGTVYQYGKMPDEIMWTDKKRERDTWIIEHHMEAKDYYLFYSEQEMHDFIDALPEAEKPPFKPGTQRYIKRVKMGIQITNKKAWDKALAVYYTKLKTWRKKLAKRKRKELAGKSPISPEVRFTRDARAALHAVIDQHVTFDGFFDKYQTHAIQRQVGLILTHYLKLYRETTHWKPSEEIPF